jgi:UTP:GlnB (protein PII) uridylyltransferase
VRDGSRPGRIASFAGDRERRTVTTDRWLASLLGSEPGVALVAVGGYGRRELLPGSDLDVLLLHGARPGIAALADRIWYPIWDSGTRLDHAVRRPADARRVARRDVRVALGLLHARHVAGDPKLTSELRLGALADWRAAARTRLAEVQALHVERTARSGELAFLLEPDLKEARGGLRDAEAIYAVAAAWVAPGPGPRARAAQETILDTRHALHEVTGRATDRLVLQEQDEVARVLGLADADALLRHLAGAGRTIAYALDQSLRQAQRNRSAGAAARGAARGAAGVGSAARGVAARGVAAAGGAGPRGAAPRSAALGAAAPGDPAMGFAAPRGAAVGGAAIGDAAPGAAAVGGAARRGAAVESAAPGSAATTRAAAGGAGQEDAASGSAAAGNAASESAAPGGAAPGGAAPGGAALEDPPLGGTALGGTFLGGGAAEGAVLDGPVMDGPVMDGTFLDVGTAPERAGGRVAGAWVRGGRFRGGRSRAAARRRPLADGLVEQDGEVVLARSADPAADPVLPLRAAAAAAEAGLPLAPRTLARLQDCPPLPVPWPPGARDALATLLGAGRPAIGVWEALDQEGMLPGLIPDWDRVRNRPQRNPLHTFTVDRHLVETAAHAAALTRDVARPDLLLLAALLHDIGKGWPGDHRITGEVVARDTTRRMGLAEADTELVAGAVRHHLLLPNTATRRDLDDPETVAQVAAIVGSAPLLEMLHALAIADGRATGPAAWNDWKAGLVADLVRRVGAVLGGEPAPAPLPLSPRQIALAEAGQPAAMVAGSEVTVVAPDRPGLLWRAAAVLASHRLAVRSANATSHGAMAVTAFAVAHPYGDPPDSALVTADLRRALASDLDVTARLERLERQGRIAAPPSLPGRPALAPPKVTLVDDASRTATVVEVRAHDAPGLLWRIGRALCECGLDVRAARVETLGAEAVDVFYVVGADGGPVTDATTRGRIAAQVLAALTG